MNLAIAVDFAQKSKKILDKDILVNEMTIMRYMMIMARGVSDNQYIVMAAFVASLIDSNLDNPGLWGNIKKIIEANNPHLNNEGREVYFTNLMNYVVLVRNVVKESRVK